MFELEPNEMVQMEASPHSFRGMCVVVSCRWETRVITYRLNQLETLSIQWETNGSSWL
jgi:hypothetical protein